MEDQISTFLVGKVSNRIRRKITEMTSSSPYTGAQEKALSFLVANNGEAIYQKDIEQEFTLRPSSATELLKKMEESGLVFRTQEEKDARLKRIILTEKAEQHAKEIEKDIEAIESAATRGIKPKDLETFKKVCLKMLENLELIDN